MQNPVPSPTPFSKLKQLLQKDDSQQGHKQFLQVLKQNGESINLTDKNLLLRSAISQQKKYFKDIYIALQKYGVDINFADTREKKSNLMIACELKKQQIVQILLQNQKIDCLQEDSRNKNALFYSITNKNKAAGEHNIRMLLKRCPQLQMVANIKKYNPLIQSLISSRIDIAKTLLEFGMNPNQIVNDQNNTVFFETIKLINKEKNKSGLKNILQLMLEKGADPYLKNLQGKNGFQIAEKFVDELKALYEQVRSQKRAIQNQQVPKKQSSTDKKYMPSKDKKNGSKTKYQPYADKYQGSKQKYREKTKNDEQAASAILRINTPQQREQVFTQAEQIYDKYKKISQTEKKTFKQIVEDEDSGYDDDPFEPALNFTDKLTEEITNFEKNCIKDHQNARKQLDDFMNFLNPIVHGIGFKMEVYGSYATGLWINHCDIDILLIPIHEHVLIKCSEQYLQYIGNKLKGTAYQKHIIVRNTKIPLIRIQADNERPPRKIDLSILSSNNNGRQHVQYISQLIHLYPEIKPLFFIIKKLTHSYKLNDPLKSGVRSFALFLMLVIFMAEKNGNQNLGALLVKFLFKYGYACDYDYEDNVMVLHLPDPVNAKNNIGKKTDAFSLQRMFKSAYLVLHTRDAASRIQYLFQSREMFGL